MHLINTFPDNPLLSVILRDKSNNLYSYGDNLHFSFAKHAIYIFLYKEPASSRQDFQRESETARVDSRHIQVHRASNAIWLTAMLFIYESLQVAPKFPLRCRVRVC